MFLDTAVLKLAGDRVIRAFKRTKTIQWGSQSTTPAITQFREVPRRPQPGTSLEKDAAVLPFIAELATAGRLDLLWHLDGALEFGRLPDTDAPSGRFYGAPLTWVNAPVRAGRVIADGRKPMREHQRDFLRSRKDSRFLEVQMAIGVKEGSNNFDNQLLDAYHIWCAEQGGAKYFLTTDYKIGKHLVSHRSHQLQVDVVAPRELLADLRRRTDISYVDYLWNFLRRLDRILRARPTTGLEDLARFGAHLERQGYYD